MLQFMGSQRVRHDCETNISFYFLLCPYSVFISTVSFLSLCVCVQSHLTFCDTMDWSLPGSWPWDYPGKNNGASCHFLLQGIYQPKDQTCASCDSCIIGGFFTTKPQGKPSFLSLNCYYIIIQISICVLTKSFLANQETGWRYDWFSFPFISTKPTTPNTGS